MTTSTTPQDSDRNRSGYYDKPGLRLRLLQMLLHTDDMHQEALLGDLLEERAGGRSRWWFWVQVAYAAVLIALRDVRVRRLRALRAILVGWLVAQGIGSIGLFAVFAYAVPASVPSGQFAGAATALYFIVLVAAGGGAWAVTRLNPRHEGPMLIAFLTATMLAAAAALASGLTAGPLNVLSPALTLVFCFVVLPIAIVAGGTLGRRVEVQRTA